MEQARYWMWSKHKNSLNSHVVASTNTSYGDSWEEQAFAEDAAGPLGGCIWPPRSYTCSFCRREFKSAQALGGHMNVHRRDRARLKQSPSPNNELLHHNHTLSIQHPSQISNMLYNPNSDSDHVFVASPSSPSRVSVPPSQVSCDENSLVPPFSSQVIQEQHRRTSLSSPPLRSNLVADRYFHISDLKKEEKNSKYIESKRKAKEDYVTADLSVSLNLVVCSTCPTTSGEKEEIMTCKRRRTDATVSFFPKPISNDRNHSKSEVLELGQNSIEDLDLELRLGDRPKVK